MTFNISLTKCCSVLEFALIPLAKTIKPKKISSKDKNTRKLLKQNRQLSEAQTVAGLVSSHSTQKIALINDRSKPNKADAKVISDRYVFFNFILSSLKLYNLKLPMALFITKLWEEPGVSF